MNAQIIKSLALACVLDSLIGDPRSILHPVEALGKLENFLEAKLYSQDATESQQFLSGLILLLALTGSSYFAAHIISKMPLVRLYFLQAALAERSLLDAGKDILQSLDVAEKTGDIRQAQVVLSQYVGRDTRGFSASHIAKAGVETLAENTSDGFVVPLFWMALGAMSGRALEFGWLYKAVSTLDSMVGYKNERYLYFGRASAKTDDIFAFIPARITALSTVIASKCLGFNAQKSLQVLCQDGRKHESPNAGMSEAAFAGALDIELGGPAVYTEKVVDHPRINAQAQTPCPNDLKKAHKLSKATAFISSIVIIGVSAFISSKLKED